MMEKVQIESRTKLTQRGLTYRYLFSPPQPGKLTLALIHGFPSTSRDWYQQIDYFQPRGYGLVVVDLLGFGETDKPDDPAAFLHTAIAQDIVDILDGEGVKNVAAIGHDWGSVITSALSIKHSDRFVGFGFTAVGYVVPGKFYTMDLLLEFQKQKHGRPLYGYWNFFGSEGADSLIRDNIDAFLEVIYPANPEIWKVYMNIPGKLEEFMRQKKTLPRAPYLTPEHYDHIKASLLNGRPYSALNWYKSTIQGVNNDISATVTEDDLRLKKPAFFAGAKCDHVCLSESQLATTKEYATAGLTIVEVDAGHWLLLEKPKEFNEALERWLTETFGSG